MTSMCSYPRLGPNCEQTFSSLRPSYGFWRCVFIVLGGAGLTLTASRLRGVCRQGTCHQQVIFPLLLLSSALLLVAGIDPQGYGGILSLLTFNLLTAIYSCIIWTVAFSITLLWIVLLQRNLDGTVALGMKLMVGLHIVALWVAKLVQASVTGLNPTEDRGHFVTSCTAVLISAQTSSALFLLLLGYTLQAYVDNSLPRSASMTSHDTHEDEYVLNQSSIGSSFQEHSSSSQAPSSTSSLALTGSIQGNSLKSRLLSTDSRSLASKMSSMKLQSLEEKESPQETNLIQSFAQVAASIQLPEAPCRFGQISKVKQVVIAMSAVSFVVVVAETCVLVLAISGKGFPWVSYHNCLTESSSNQDKICNRRDVDLENIVIVLSFLLLLLDTWVFWKLPPQPPRCRSRHLRIDKAILVVDTAGRSVAQEHEAAMKNVEELMPEEFEAERLSGSTTFTPPASASNV